MSRASFHVEDVDRAVARAELGQAVAHRFGRRRAAPRAASASEQPAGEQRGQRRRVRAAGAVRRRNVEALDGDLDMLRPVEEMVDRLAVPAGDDRRRRAELDQPLGELGLSLGALPASACASSRFGVTTVASGKSRVDERIDRVGSSSARARRVATITGSTTSGTGCSARKPATASITAREKSIPVFAASTPMSEKTASSCATTNSGGTSWTAVTPTVFCAVSATIADIPWAPAAAKAFRSAWMPAPPPLSEPAIVSTRGTLMRLPSPA